MNGKETQFPSDFVIEQHWPRVHVRGFSKCGAGAMWSSNGYLALSLLQYARLWLRALRRPQFPRAWVHR